MACIYKITNQVNGKAYIGQSIHDASKTRIRSHFKGCGGAIALANAIDKYGKDAFTWEILDDGIIPELVDSYEIESIEKHGTLSPSGYNLTRGGESGQFSEESRRKMSESSRAENLSAKTRRKMSEVQKGKKHTKEARRKMSASRIGKKHAKETKRKISEGRRGKKHTEESKCKMSESHKGKPLSEETKPTKCLKSEGVKFSLKKRDGKDLMPIRVKIMLCMARILPKNIGVNYLNHVKAKRILTMAKNYLKNNGI